MKRLLPALLASMALALVPGAARAQTVTKAGATSIGKCAVNGATKPCVLMGTTLVPLPVTAADLAALLGSFTGDATCNPTSGAYACKVTGINGTPYPQSGLIKSVSGAPTPAVAGTDYVGPSGGLMTGPLSSQINPICNPLSGAQATDGTQSYVISCYGAWMGNSPTAFSVAPTRGTTYTNGAPTPNVMNTGFLVNSSADGNLPNNIDGMALDFQSIGGSVSASFNPQNNAVGFFESVRQAPDSNGRRPPFTWAQNWDFHIAPGAGNVQSYLLEGDLNNFNMSCGVGAGCLSVWEWFNGINSYANTAQMYGGGATVTTFSGQATTSGNTLTVASFTGGTPQAFTTDLTWVQVSGTTSTTAASTATSVAVASATGIYRNQTVAGAGVPSNTIVLGVSGLNVTLSQAVNVSSGAPLTFTGMFAARYTSGTTATTFRTMPTNSTAVNFTASIAQSHFGWFENGWEQILEADARLADAAVWGIQLYGDHKIGFDTTYDLTSLALNAAAGQSVCFNNTDWCLSYAGGFLNLKQNGSINWFVDGQGSQHTFGLYAGAGGVNTTGHFYGTGAAPGISASAGTPALSASANDNHGTVTNGSTAGATVTLTWASPRTNPPDCIVQNIGSGTLTRTVPTTTSIQLTFSAAGGQATYICLGQ